MATVLEKEIENPEYINFLKVGLGLKELQKGLGPFIEGQLKKIHCSTISRLGVSNCPSGCTSANIILHAQCDIRSCICKRQPAPRRLCQTGTCMSFYNELVKQHRTRNPQLENTDVSAWFVNHWEFGKCFMPRHCSDNKTSAVQCDASALLTLIINCIPFEQVVGVKIQTSPKKTKDVFSEVRAISNVVGNLRNRNV